MLKITIIDTPDRRRLVLEGKLVAPWVAELRRECREAAADLRGRQIVIELRSVTYISEDGENVLLELMKEGVRFRSSGVFTKHVMKRLARKSRRNAEELRDEDRQY
jgi:anti-anti-sigma regulatory factor